MDIIQAIWAAFREPEMFVVLFGLTLVVGTLWLCWKIAHPALYTVVVLTSCYLSANAIPKIIPVFNIHIAAGSLYFLTALLAVALVNRQFGNAVSRQVIYSAVFGMIFFTLAASRWLAYALLDVSVGEYQIYSSLDLYERAVNSSNLVRDGVLAMILLYSCSMMVLVIMKLCPWQIEWLKMLLSVGLVITITTPIFVYATVQYNKDFVTYYDVLASTYALRFAVVAVAVAWLTYAIRERRLKCPMCGDSVSSGLHQHDDDSQPRLL